MQPHDTTTKLRAPRCSTCKKAMRLDGTCTNCAKPEVDEYYRLEAQGKRRCTACKEVLPFDSYYPHPRKNGKIMGMCKVCSNAQNKAYRAANAERLKVKQDSRKQERHETYKRWYADPENRRKLRAYAKRWKQLNPDRDLEHSRKWRQANTHKTKAYMLNRRAKLVELPNTLTQEDWQHAIDCFGGRCAYCGNQPGLFHYTDLSAEHFIPLSSPNCPGTTPDNIIPVCLSCNTSRKQTDITTWLSSKFSKREAKITLERISSYFKQFANNNDT